MFIPIPFFFDDPVSAKEVMKIAISITENKATFAGSVKNLITRNRNTPTFILALAIILPILNCFEVLKETKDEELNYLCHLYLDSLSLLDAPLGNQLLSFFLEEKETIEKSSKNRARVVLLDFKENEKFNIITDSIEILKKHTENYSLN